MPARRAVNTTADAWRGVGWSDPLSWKRIE